MDIEARLTAKDLIEIGVKRCSRSLSPMIHQSPDLTADDLCEGIAFRNEAVKLLDPHQDASLRQRHASPVKELAD